MKRKSGVISDAVGPEGPVHVEVPFADRIRMASVKNRRNPEVLLDLVASHALVHLFQREREELADGGLVVTATEADFAYASRLFADLHTVGGSLEAKFDRNENLLLGLAARDGVERFTVNDVQTWTGWPYYKARRLMVGRVDGRIRYPGLLDKSPALSVLDTTKTEDDGDGRDVKKRQLVFLFNPELYRESRATGLVWLEPEETPSRHDSGSGTAPARPPARPGTGPEEDGSPNGAVLCESEDPTCQDPGIIRTGTITTEESDDISASESPARRMYDPDRKESDSCSEQSPPPVDGARGRARPRAGDVPERDSGTSINPHAFVAIDGPEWKRCAVCDAKPSFYREKWVRGMKERRRLGTRCYGAAVEREQGRVVPSPAVIDPAAMRRVTASIGRCDLCRLEAATWKGETGRLCDACYQWEVRRAVEQGKDVLVPTHGPGAADVRS